ncbi:MAG: hypothetical protein M1429_02160 [Patescibacteria group bacterium]|nr:hypothetical protein [Patescibacteria group bacterium]
MTDCLQFLEDRIRKAYGLPSNFEITEDWLREKLDELDRQATSINRGNSGNKRYHHMKLLTHKESIERLQRIRSATF